MRRDKITIVILAALSFSLLAAASSGLWLLWQPPPGIADGASTLLGLGRDQVFTGLMLLSLANLVLLAGYLLLQWPLLAAGAAALLPHATVRGLAAGAAALGALVLLSLPWLGKGAGPATVQPAAEPAAPAAALPAVATTAAPTVAAPLRQTPTAAAPARRAPKVAAVRPQPLRAAAVRRVPPRPRHVSVHRPYWRQPTRVKPVSRPCKGRYVSRPLLARY